MEKFRVDGIDEVSKQLIFFDSKIKQTSDSLLTLIKNASEFKKSFSDIKGLKEFVFIQQENEKLTNKIKKETSELNKLEKERINLVLKLEQVKTDEYKQNEIIKKQIAEKTNLVKEEIKTEEEKLKTQQKIDAQVERQRLVSEKQAKKTEEQGRAYVVINQELSKYRKNAQDLASELIILEQNGKKNTQQYKTLALQLSDTAKKVSALDGSIKTIDSSVGLNQRNVGNYASALKGIGSQLIGAFGVVGGVQLFASVVQSSIKVVKDFDSAQSELSAILGVNKNDMASLKDLTIQLGSSTSFTATQTTKASTELAKLGFTMDEIKQSLKGVLDGAVAMGTSIENSASLTSKTLRAFGLDASESERVVSVLAASTNKTATSFDYLNDALPYASTGAKQLGLSVEQTTALIGLLADRGLQASTAGTSLRDIFADLSTKGITLDQAMAKINNSTDKTKTAFDIFGKTSLNAGIIIAENYDKFENLTSAITNQESALKKLVDVRLDNLEGDLKLLESAWEGLILSLESGDGVLAGVSRGFIQMTTDLLGFLTIQKTAVKETKNEQLELNILVSRITSLNEKSQERKALILELKKNYPGFLRYLDIEKASNEQIANELNNLNNEYVKKIALQKEEEKLKDVLKDQASLFESLADKQKIAFEQLNDLKVEYGLVSNIDFNDLEGSYKRLNEEAKNNGKYTLDITGSVKNWVNETKILKGLIKDQNKEVEMQKKSYSQTSDLINKAIFNVNNLKISTSNLSNETLKELQNWKKIPNAIERATAKARLYKITQAKALASGSSNFVFDNAIFDTKKGNKLKKETDELIKSTKEYKEARKNAQLENKDTFSAFDYRTGKNEKFDTKKGGRISDDIKVGLNTLSKEDIEKAEKEEIKKNKEIQKSERDLINDKIESAKASIEAQRLALEYKIQSYKTEEHLERDNLAFLELVRSEKLRFLREEKDLELQKENISAEEKKKIIARYNLDVLSTEQQIKEDRKKLQLNSKDLEIETFKVRNESILENAKTLSEELIKIERDRINKIIELEKEKLKIQYNIDDEKLNNKVRQNEKLTENEQVYLNELINLNSEFQSKNKEIDDFIFNEKIKNREQNIQLEKEQNQINYENNFQLQLKQAEEINQLENEKVNEKFQQGLITEEDFVNQKKLLDQDYYNSKQTIQEKEHQFKINLLNEGLDTFIEIAGRESDVGKGLATFKTLLNTYEGVSLALKSSAPPYNFINAGLVLAQGLAQVVKINSAPKPKFAEGTLDAPFTSLAITDELGAELHFDDKWNLKDTGSGGGARTKLIEKGDKILPADITKLIMRGELLKPNNTKENNVIDHKKLGKEIANAISKKSTKHYLVINGKITKIIENDHMEKIIYSDSKQLFNQKLY